MDSNVSVSKGVFVYKNGIKAASKKSKSKKPQSQTSTVCLSDSLWYKTYCRLWNNVETEIQTLNSEMFATVLGNLTKYVKNSHRNRVYEIPTAALLTGINMPDHSAQFKTLSRVFKEEVTPHVATLNSEDCQNLKHLIENMLKQIIKTESLSDDEDDSESSPTLKKTNCNFNYFQNWYEDFYSISRAPENGSPKKQKTKTNPKLIVVIMSDFESFNRQVLQDFILIVSTYLNVLPFVFVFGVATSVAALHRSLPYKVSSKVSIEVFNSSPSTACLNNVLEKVMFEYECPFHLGGKVFNLLSDIFLFYDLSVSGFIQSFKYAMLEHFSYGNAMALCSTGSIKKIIANFTHEDLENVRRLLSFRKLVESESPENQIQLLTDDDYFKSALQEEIEELLRYLQSFHVFLNVLTILVKDLPKAPLGKQVREIYAIAVSTNISSTPEFKECFKLLGFQSKDELCGKITNIVDFIRNNHVTSKSVKKEIMGFADKLSGFVEKINNLSTETVQEHAEDSRDFICTRMDRLKLNITLLEKSKMAKPMNQYEKLRETLLKYLVFAFDNYLSEPTTLCFHEIFFFNDISIQNHIIGSHRAAIHSALTDPQVYLQCSCCEIPDNSIILRSMPDISIAYKLHLECGKMINLYDWLQAFLSIVDPREEEGSNRVVDPQLQARFTQAVAELEFLGFIKSSKRKTDHVARLTWGG